MHKAILTLIAYLNQFRLKILKGWRHGVNDGVNRIDATDDQFGFQGKSTVINS